MGRARRGTFFRCRYFFWMMRLRITEARAALPRRPPLCALCGGPRSSSLAPAVLLSSEICTSSSSMAVAVQQQLESSGWAGSAGAFSTCMGRGDQIRAYHTSPSHTKLIRALTLTGCIHLHALGNLAEAIRSSCHTNACIVCEEKGILSKVLIARVNVGEWARGNFKIWTLSGLAKLAERLVYKET